MEPGALRDHRVQGWLADPEAEGTTAPDAWPAAVDQTGRHLVDAPEASSSPSRGRRRKRPSSLGLGAAIAVALCLIVVVSAGMMPLVLWHQATPTAAVSAAETGTPPAATATTPTTAAPALFIEIFLPPIPTPGRSAKPIPGTVFGLYQVSAGDNLTRISRSFGLSPATVYWANSGSLANPDLVKIGQRLLIPPVDGVVITAVDGDTLDAIADKHGIDPQVIADANGLTATTLTGGQILILPGVPNDPLPRPVTGAPKPEDWLNKLEWPVPGHHTLTLRFGCTNHAVQPPFGKCRHWHHGLDIGGARIGTPVVAAADGTVIYAGRRRAGTDGAAGGIVVWISHRGTLYTTYNHLSGVTVKAGQKVKAGQQIGGVGATGAASGAHLHFEVWTDYPWTGDTVADAVDPLLYTKWKPGS